MRLLFASLLFLLSASYVLGAAVIPCSGWAHYMQCDARWGSHQLGTGSLTVCQAGCAMTSVASSLYRYQSRIGGQVVTPANLNAWLRSNGGYLNGNLIIWDTVAKLGQIKLIKYAMVTRDELKKYIQHCYPVIANVLGGTHFVLVTGYDNANSDVFYVNDPYNSYTAYYFSGMSKFAVYSPKTGDELAAEIDPDLDWNAYASEVLLDGQ